MSHKVFISHTSLITDFPKGHSFLEAAIAGAKEAGWDYDDMHRFPSSPLTPAEECRRRVSQCDAFVGILGFDWGSEPPDMPDLSYTKYEFQVAQKLMDQRTVLFLIDPKSTAFPASVRISDSDREKQDKFRNDHGLHAKLVSAPSDLRHEVADALRRIIPPQPLGDMIRCYEDFIESGDFDSAWRCFQYDFKLNYKLDFELSWHNEHLTQLLKLFRDGPERNPELRDVNDIAGALNALARAYKNVGQPGKAIAIFRRELALQRTGTLHRVMGLANLTNALRLTGRFSEAEQAAQQMVTEAAHVNDPKWEAYSLYWNGVLRSAAGLTDEAVLLLRQAQVLFEHLQDKKVSAAGRGRTYAHLAQLELWLANPRGALCFGRHAQQLAKEHDEGRELIFTARLMGTANLRLGKQAESREDLERAIRDAQASGYWEEWLAAKISLAELVQRNRIDSPTTTRDLLNADARSRAEHGPYAMLLADFDVALCQILRVVGRRGPAIEAAKKAVEAALGDHSGYHYHWGIIMARRHLLELGEPQSEMPSHSTAQIHTPFADLLELDERQKTGARLRSEFTKHFRMVTGHYRYAPAKFVRLLREDWSAIRSIIEGRNVTVQPQFVEIHVGHPCNLNCQYCRGELREKPAKEKFLPKAQIIPLINEIYRMNPQAFIRFSGLIGEPLLHGDIAEILETIGKRHEMRWSLTTNGIRLEGERLLRAVLKAKHVHISLDAGSNETYRALKGGPCRTFDKVIHNIGELVKTRQSSGSRTEIVVSFLVQQMNYRELPVLAQELKNAEVDSLEVKMQHFDPRRRMNDEYVNDAYQKVEQIQRELSDERFHLIMVQTHEQAIEKVRDSSPMHFERCYANLLGLSPTVDPNGDVQMCCQYYQRTLGAVGSIGKSNFAGIWNGKQRQSSLKRNPCEFCVNCSPSDDFVNRFVQFLKDAHGQDSSFLDWVEQEVRPMIEDTTND